MNTDERLNALRGAVARLARASGWSRVGAHNECCRDHSGADCSECGLDEARQVIDRELTANYESEDE